MGQLRCHVYRVRLVCRTTTGLAATLARLAAQIQSPWRLAVLVFERVDEEHGLGLSRESHVIFSQSNLVRGVFGENRHNGKVDVLILGEMH